MRKLASIRLIKELKPIDGADNIEIAIVDGWQCVVKKGEFKVGDKGVYFEIDSFLPLGTYFDFLAKNGVKTFNGKEGVRLKTIRLRGKISQGLMLPISAFTPLLNNSIEVGTDVTELLNIEKYEIPDTHAKLAGDVAGLFPSTIKKTDQERIQNLFDTHSKIHLGRLFEISLKLDGTSMTVFSIDTEKYQMKDSYSGRKLGICSRNLQLKEKDENTYWSVAKAQKIHENFMKFCEENNRNLALQGELIGPGIQGNKEKLSTHDYFVFDIWDIDKQAHLAPKERMAIINELCLKSVPILFEEFDVFGTFKSVEEILAFADGKSMNNDNREGIVFKSIDYVDDEIISFKAISNRFLMAEK